MSNVISILQIAVEDAVWILDVPALTESLEERHWVSLFRQLLCSEALKLGSFNFHMQLNELLPWRPGFELRGDLQLLADTFPHCIDQLRANIKNILCLRELLLGRPQRPPQFSDRSMRSEARALREGARQG